MTIKLASSVVAFLATLGPEDQDLFFKELGGIAVRPEKFVELPPLIDRSVSSYVMRLLPFGDHRASIEYEMFGEVIRVLACQ